MEHPDFLKKKYDLHSAPETESAVRRALHRKDADGQVKDKISQKPAERIQAYLDRFTEIIERKEPAKRERGIEALKEVLHKKFIIKEEEIPEAYFETQKRIAREQGHGDIEISRELRDQATEVIITDQESSLDAWIDYLSSSDATYPDWLKYFAFRNIVGMGDYDKEKKQFTKRTKGTTKPFPDINREALAYVLDAIEKKYQKKPTDQDPEFQQLLQGENFAKLYAFAIDKVTPATESALADTRGQWVKYRQGKDHMPLVESLQGHGTGWCTAGESTAKVQLENGDFYVFYSLDEQGKPNIPRVAIRMQQGNIAEVRGIAPDQNLDPYIGDVVKTKLQEFPDGQQYEKKNTDMKMLTQIERKTTLRKNSGQESEPLTKEEIIFLYEINQPIEGFGYQRDPRIEEIRSQRDPNQDAPIVFECEPSQIAHSQKEITEETKAYIGPWNMEIFQQIRKYSNIQNLFESFPDKKIFRQTLETNPEINSSALAEEAIKRKNIYLSDWGNGILNKTEFSQEAQTYELVRFSVKQLGLEDGATTQEIYDKAEALGLELCPAEVGPHLRLQYPGKELMYIAMEQIAGRLGYPSVFDLGTDGGQLGLYGNYASPDDRWDDDSRFVFLFRK